MSADTNKLEEKLASVKERIATEHGKLDQLHRDWELSCRADMMGHASEIELAIAEQEKVIRRYEVQLADAQKALDDAKAEALHEQGLMSVNRCGTCQVALSSTLQDIQDLTTAINAHLQSVKVISGAYCEAAHNARECGVNAPAFSSHPAHAAMGELALALKLAGQFLQGQEATLRRFVP